MHIIDVNVSQSYHLEYCPGKLTLFGCHCPLPMPDELSTRRDNSGAVEFAEFVEIMTTTIAEQEGGTAKSATAEAPKSTWAFRSAVPRFRKPAPSSDSRTGVAVRREAELRAREKAKEELRAQVAKAARQKHLSEGAAMSAGVLPFSIMAKAYRRQRVLDSIDEGNLTVLADMHDRYIAEKEETERRAEIQVSQCQYSLFQPARPGRVAHEALAWCSLV